MPRSASPLPRSLLLEPELHSSPLLSIHTQGAAGERAPPLRDQRGNVSKFWNLKPWRGYLAEGSLESVSTEKTPAPCFCRVEGAGFGGNIEVTFFSSLLLRVVDFSPCVSSMLLFSPRLYGACGCDRIQSRENNQNKTRGKDVGVNVHLFRCVEACVGVCVCALCFPRCDHQPGVTPASGGYSGHRAPLHPAVLINRNMFNHSALSTWRLNL